MNHKLRNKLFAFSLVILATTSLALPEDRQKTITGRSNEKTIETSTGIINLSGKVFITQGNLEIYADYTTLETNQKNNQIEYLVAEGNPARFIDLPSLTGSKVEVSGLKVEFYPNKDMIITTGKAEISQNGNVVHGERIEYNTVTGVMNIHSQRSETGNPDDAQAELIIMPGALN